MSHTSHPGFFAEVAAAVAEERLVTTVTVIDRADLEQVGRRIVAFPDGTTLGSLGSEQLDALALEAAAAAIKANATAPTLLTDGNETLEVFVEVHSPPPCLIMIGAVHTAVHLTHFASRLGWRTVVLDARAAFATEERFPHADELIVEWPADALAKRAIHEETYFAFLSHDQKLDNPALVVALNSPARYVGALGSKKTHAKRTADLLERGVPQDQIDKIYNPIGLKLGGRRPEDIALGVAAQLVQARYGKS